MSDTAARPEDPARPAPHPAPRATTRPTASGLFRSFWRWHFYASFLVAPILLVLAVTGLIYLFRFDLEPALHPDLMRVEQPAGVDFSQPYAAQQRAVADELPGAAIVSMSEPRDADSPTVFSVVLPDGEPRDVFVDPWTTEVLGSLDPDTTVSGYAIRLHGELMAGPWAEHLIELAACWALVMALTGYYLFWKGRAARARQRKAGAGGLRSWHARVGLVAGLGLVGLLVSGLPWTGVFGATAQELATAQGSSLWSTDPGALSDPTSTLDESLPHGHGAAVPWGMGRSEVPASGHEGAFADIDTAVAVADAEGLRHPYTVALPTDQGAGGHGGGHGGGGGSGVYSVIGYAFDAPADERTVHVDAYGGQVRATYGFDDYPVLAKVVSQGIGLHEGRSLGLWSFWGAALMCLAIIAMCVTGPLMWWRRRPQGSLGAPRGRMPLRGTPVLLVALVVLRVVLPLFGLSLVVVLLLDQLVIRRVPRLASYLNAS